MKGHRLMLRSLVFLMLLVVAVYGIQGVFSIDDQMIHDDVRGFYSEKKGSLDGVFIGSSAVYAFWQPLCAWHENGIAVWNWSIPAMPPLCVKYHLIEARKRQPNALYIIALNVFKSDAETTRALDTHRNTNYMPLSLNKLRLLNAMVSRLDTQMTVFEKLEFYLPVICFHSRWDDLKPWTFDAGDMDYKSSNHASYFLNNTTDFSGRMTFYEGTEPIGDDLRATLDDLLDYCDAHRLNVLFVKAPQHIGTQDQGRMNTAEQIVLERGYPCLDLTERMDDMAIDLRMDFYNDKHANIHGSLKVTRLLGDYLTEQYGFADKRGTPGWDSWDRAAEAYMAYIGTAALDFERAGARRAVTDVPTVLAGVHGRDVALSWKGVDGADGYAIYRKRKGEVWQALAEVGPDVTEYPDSGLEASTVYLYTVVPLFRDDGGIVYGSFNMKGVSAKTKG